MSNKEEILKALQIIKKTCEKQEGCEKCPLSKSDFCMVQGYPPQEWRIKTQETTWKAFED